MIISVSLWNFFSNIFLFIYLFIYLLKSNWRSNLYNHRIYKDVLVQQDLEGREHLI